MTTPTTPLDKPTRGTVDKLFRELADKFARFGDGADEYDRLYRELRGMEEEFKRQPKYRALERKVERARRNDQDRRNAARAKVWKVRMEYLAKGLTPAVAKKIEAMVKELQG